MKFLKYLSVRNKLILVSLAPLLALIYFFQDTVRKELLRKEASTEVYSDFQEVERISNLIHELQKERGLALIYLFNKDNDDRNTLIGQFTTTDKAVGELRNIYREHEKNATIIDLLDTLPELRNDVETFPGKIMKIRLALLKEIQSTSQASKNAEIKNLMASHLFLLYAKEYFSRIRSTLNLAILSNGFRKGEYARFSSLKGQYEINLYKFRENASPELAEFFNTKFLSPPVRQSHLLIDSVFATPEFVETKVQERWWTNSSATVNGLKEVEDLSLDMIREKAEAELQNITNSVFINIIIALLVGVLIIALVSFTIKDILTSISQIRNAAERITKGEVDIVLDITSKDEVGDLARSFNRMAAVTSEYAQFADSVGKGDYGSAVKVRSETDLLGKALNNMKESLQNLSKENDIRTWLLSGNGELNDVVRGEKDIINLAQDIISQLTTYLKAQIGAIYIKENGRLRLVGSYAFQDRKNNANTFSLGQGFVGQAALEKKPILFQEIPEDYIKINSGLGNATPRNIIVYPFLYEGEVKGVIEIGSSREFSALDREFLEMVADNIGIAINGAQAKERMQQLLEETQKQAEELEVQQEELKQSNEELQEKTTLLERSEGELKAQQEELQQTNEELEEKANLLEEQKQVLEDAKMQIENKARELETTSKYKSEFLANMSHELRTPLNSILILSQILSENKSNILGDKEINYAKNIYNSGADLLNLINEILDLSKVEAGKMDLDIAEFTVNEVCENIKTMFEEIAKNKAINFDIEMMKNSARLNMRSDKQRLDQILKNLLSNAFKFTEAEGRVHLSVRYPATGVQLRRNELKTNPDVIAFAVTDTGIGIPQKKLDIIFEAFQQVDGSTNRKYGGTGLGLSISRELAHTLGGEIHLESIEGKGSTFTLYLPLQFDGPPSEKRSYPVESEKIPPAIDDYQVSVETALQPNDNIIDDRNSISQNDRTILIMEDDVDFAHVLLDFVREREYKGIVAYQGNTGLSYARQYKPDAIILDMKLPIVDGAEVLKQLKNDPELRHIPVQIVSGYDRKQEGLSLGAFDFIRKPVSQQGLWNALDKIEDFSSKIKRLLIVEDDKQHNEAVKQLIGNGDVKCFSAYSGKEAFEMLRADPFDCIIVDLGLPDMSGFDLLEKIKKDKELVKTPVIIYTGKDLTKEENRKLEKLASTVVLKTAHSHERLLDETMLFLHRVEAQLPREKQKIIRKLHKTSEVLINKQVLVVDDDIRNVYSLTNALEEEGLQCITAENGKEAIQALKQNQKIDIVLMDVMMPEMDGYEATREIRKSEKHKKLPVIALTAKAMKGDREKCLAAGMSDYISKPVNIEQLLSLMRVWLYK